LCFPAPPGSFGPRAEPRHGDSQACSGAGSPVGSGGMFARLVDVRSYTDHLRRDGFALAHAAEGRLGDSVPSCPEWNVADLVWHTGEVHHFWGEIAGRGLRDYHDVRRTERPDDAELLDWFREGVERLAEMLGTADPETEVWTWSPQHDIAWIQRRMAQETAVHRWDAQAAAGAPKDIDGRLAADGIDEFLEFFITAEPERLTDAAESIHLHSTDDLGEWLVRVHDGQVTVAREHAKGDAAVRAPVSDLLLLLWRRKGASEVEVIGDSAALERFLGRADLE
jgi:uncharacterized protein (TIGR03083 family)